MIRGPLRTALGVLGWLLLAYCYGTLAWLALQGTIAWTVWLVTGR